MKRKRKGYMITLEVAVTILTLSLFIQATTYILLTLNTQRYVDTVLTTTAIQTSKWGGTNSNAYFANGMDYDVVANAQRELDRNLDPKFKAKITASPSKVTTSNNKVVCTISWTYPGIFFMPEIDKTVTIKLDSIMKPGNLL